MQYYFNFIALLHYFSQITHHKMQHIDQSHIQKKTATPQGSRRI